MAPEVGRSNLFEMDYKQKFRGIAAKHGLLIRYDDDLAATDVGIQLYEPRAEAFGSSRNVSNARVWFQLKGKEAASFPRDLYDTSADVPVRLETRHLQFWYASPEVVYLAVYIECAGHFLAEDVRDIVERQFPEGILHPNALKNQETVTVRIKKSAVLTDRLFEQMDRHRSMRIDGPTFQGMALGHSLDPLRCTLKKLEPSVFTRIVHRLLEVHDYRLQATLDVTNPPFNLNHGADEFSLTAGIMYQRYQWVGQLFTAFGFESRGDELQPEGEPQAVRGPCVVLIHSRTSGDPSAIDLGGVCNYLRLSGIRNFLAFVNEDDTAYFGAYFRPLLEAGFRGWTPQLLGEVAYKLLTSTVVYLEFRTHINWQYVNYLWMRNQHPE